MTRRCLFLLVLLLIASPSLVSASHRATPSQATTHRVFMPQVAYPQPLNPFGYDVRTYSSKGITDYITRPRPQWGRAGDVIWASVESTRGTYNWAAMADVVSNIQRLRSLDIEPVVVVQTSPTWAQSISGRICSAPKDSAMSDFVTFMATLAARYPEVSYWEIWNEPDYASSAVSDDSGTGCWGDASKADYGGSAYGEMLKKVYPAMKAANPNAKILGGALAYLWPHSTNGVKFLNGMLSVGAGAAMDALSFHAYGDWGAGDLIVNKTVMIRQQLKTYGYENLPLFATEIGVLCYTWPDCPTSFNNTQANYAARIYAQVMALDIQGAFWFTLVFPSTNSVLNAQLIDQVGDDLQPRPAYYAFRNSAILMLGAEYIGPTITSPPDTNAETIQSFQFRKQESSLDNTRGSTLYVLWVNKFDWTGAKAYAIQVPKGAKAVCAQTIQDDISGPYLGYCSDDDEDGIIWVVVNSFPQYVEVIDS